MSRINKIVSRRKEELGQHGTQQLLSERKTIKSNVESYDYTQTRTMAADAEVFRKNRLISIDPTDPRATRFQMLRTKILQQMRKKSWNTLAISAPTSGAGKSLVAANLAAAIAQEGNQSVLLVDMDLRSPSIHNYFGFEPEHGLHDCLDGTVTIEETMVNPGVDRLVVVPGRKGVINSSEQISTPYVKNLVEELKSRYESRIVIFDLPPILLTDDVMVFLPYIDCSLLVVESGVNTQKDVEDALALVGQNPIIGTVLNKSDDAEQNLMY